MSRLSKQKRNQLVVVTLIIVLVVAGLWFTLIRYQLRGLHDMESKKAAGATKLSQVLDTKKNSAQIEAELASVSNKLALLESDMASGDYYSAMVNTIQKFKMSHKVEIPQFNNPGAGAVDVNLLPNFPYKQFTVSISGSGYYYDLGKFIADFENEYPSSRILNLELTPASASSSEEKEKLSFKLDIVSLVKPGGSSPARKP